MAGRASSAWALALTLALAACGAVPTPEAREGAAPVRRERASDGCPADETLLGSTCWSATGTRWQVVADGPGGRYSFELTLLGAGRVRSTDHAAAGPAHDEWFQQGETLRILLADRFVEYRAPIHNGTVLVGEARNVRSARWAWRADRQFAEAACARSEARVDDVCLTVEGTRWRIESDARLIEFLANGVLGLGDGAPEATQPGTWSQRAEALRFAFGEGAATFSAVLTDADRMEGEATGPAGERRFVAVREPSLPPP